MLRARASSEPPGTLLYVAKRYGVAVESAERSGRTLRDYCRLPASRYNLLDSKAVTRCPPPDEDTFRVSTGMQQLASVTAEPVGYVRLRILPDGVEQSLLRGELLSERPSSVVDEINATLGSVRLLNTVTSERGADGRLLLVCQLVLSGNFTRGMMSKVPAARLNGVMAWAVSVAMPWFIQKLAGDYAAWAEDKPRSSTMGAGEMGALARNLLAGGGRLPAGVIELAVVDAKDGATALAPSADELGEQDGVVSSGQPKGANAGSSTRGVGFGAKGKSKSTLDRQ